MSYYIEGKIRLVVPCLFNKPTESAKAALEGGQSGTKKTVKQELKECEEKMYRDAKGNIVLSGDAFKKSIMFGAKMAKLKVGKDQIGPYLNALLWPEDAPFGTKEPDYVDERIATNQKAKSMIIARRPAFKAGREIPFRIMVVGEQLQEKQIRIAVENAGVMAGIGSYRPKFGRFEVVEWKVA